MRRPVVLALSSTLLAAARPRIRVAMAGPDASKATGENPAGETVPVMHACGHDVHPDEVRMQLTVRAFRAEVLDHDRSGSAGGRGARAVWEWRPRLRRQGAE